MKKKLLSTISTFAFIFASVSLLTVHVFTAIAERFHESEEIAFNASDSNGYQYSCRTLVEDPFAVSIAWADVDKSTTPNHLELPSSLNYQGTDYTVKCISYGGFSNCDFEEVVIPNSITEIKPEGFMCCVNLVEIVLPSNLTAIQCATFMDCRKLETVKYAHEGLPVDSVNNTIEIIEDNAFMSCYKLKEFTMPKSVLEIGRCAFENCQKLAFIFLPSNPIVIRSYAFSKCNSLSAFHIPSSVTCIEDFAFTQCDNLTLYFQVANEASIPSAYGTYFMNLYSSSGTSLDTSKVKTAFDVPSISSSLDYPGLVYSITLNGSIVSENKGITVWKSNYSFATLITYSRTDTDDIDGFMEDQVLTLPDYVHDDATNQDYPLAVIGPKAFENHTELKGIVHNQHLVRIWYSAYAGCSELEELRFENCLELKEIGWREFGDKGNDKIESLVLPNSLTYMWTGAFYNLTRVSYLSFRTNPLEDFSLMNISNNCFQNLGKNATTTFDLELPCSLSNNGQKLATGGNCAIGNNAFNGAKSIKTIRMLECDHGIHGLTNNNTSEISFDKNSFSSCSKLTKFIGSSQLKVFSSGTFSGCGALKELFLNLQRNTSSSFGWDPVFLGSNDIVVYTDREPNDKSWLNPSNKYLRESTGTNPNPADDSSSAGPIPYYVLGIGNLETGVTYYLNNNIATIQENGKTTITQYFGSGGILDLTTIQTPTPIAKIGNFAFGGKSLTKVYIPNTIEEIGDRAFMSTQSGNQDLSTNALTIFTYKVNGTIATDPNNQSQYCRLPASCKKIGNFAFYNNRFISVTSDQRITSFGISAFSTVPKITSSDTGHKVNSVLQYFDKINVAMDNTAWNGNCLYYTNNGDYEALLYTIQALETGELTIEDGTKYINAEAIFGTGVTTVNIPSSVKTIYGFGVASNPYLTKIGGDLSGIKYINGSHLESGDSEAWNSTDPMKNNTSYNNGVQLGAFQRNKLLTTFDFTQLTNLYDIGKNAFLGDSALAKMSDTQPQYKYYKNSLSTTPTVVTSGIFDLRNSTKLRHIAEQAFLECKSLKYLHLPDTTGNNPNIESKLTLENKKIFSDTCNLLVGERAIQASDLIANVQGGVAYNTNSHYPVTSTSNCASKYYYAEDASDISDKNISISYWTYGNSSYEFILFDDASKASEYFGPIN